ncbi:MAG: cadherin-like beta sandwich domain-containing protein, partial [Firmicutes bacterium]|nr:cadherin-like beta sandwich domain-containing protein [Bacillota bacterium]
VSGAEVTASTPVEAVSPKDPGNNYNGPSAGCWLTLTNLNFYELGPNGYGAGYFEYYLQNAFAALDAENEWWYDGGSGTLWLQLPAGQDPNSLDVYYKARATGMDMSSRKNIVMEGVDLLGCGFSMANAENCVIDGMTALYPASVLSPGNESEVSGAVISGSNNTLMNSEIAYCSGPILSISGQGHKIVNNKLHDAITGPILYKFLLNIQGRDHLIKNNEIYNARGALIGGTFYACEISYNRMYNANWQVSDTGIMYMAYGDYGGTQIHHNIFYNSLQNFSCGVYFDLNCKNALVYNNVMYDIPWAAMFINSGAEFISAINNTAYNTAQGRSTEEIYSNAPNDMYMSIFANNIVDSRGVGTDNADVGAIAFNNYARPQGDASTFNGPAYHDFTLQPGSGAIGYGAGIPGLHDTQTVDAGAFQYGAEPWQAGVLPYKATLSDVSAGARIIPNVLQNLLKNSAFEWPRLGEDTPGDGNSIPYWTKTGAKTASVHTSTGDLATWAHSREERAIDLTGGAGDGIEQTVTGLTPGAEYIVRGFARMGTPGGAADGQQVEIGVRIGGESVASQTLNAARWREARIKFTADGSGTATVYATKTTDGSRALVDDFSVVLAGYVSEEAPVVGDEYPMYNSPVALVDDMLYGAAPWDVSANAEFAKDEPTGLTLASADGAPAYAFYTKEKYSDKDFYMMLDGSQALDALDMTVELGARDSDLSLNPNRYEIAVKGGAVTLVRWYNTTPYTLGEWPFNASSPLIKARSTFDLGESSYGTVTITLKSGNDVIFTYADNSNLNIPAPGYFGLATSSSVKLARVTEYVPIGNLIADQANWVAGSTITWGGDGTWMTLDEGSGGAGAGYIGRKFGDSEFVMAFKAGLYPGSYPYIAMRVQNEAQLKRLNWFRDGNAYQIIIKEDIFETQEWGTGADNNGILFYTNENGETVPGIADNHAFVPPDKSTLIKTSIVNTDYGVWLRLKVGDTIVSSWMDQNKYILSDGYFGFAATHEPVTLSVPNADTYAPEIGDPDKVATEEKYDTTLASLAVDGYDLVPAFDPAVLEYGLTIPGNVETVNISAAAASDKAAVSGDLGAMSAAVGENVYHVYVQAPNGDTTAYTVTVTRETPAVFVMTVKSMAAKIGKPLQIPFTYEGPGPVTFKSSNAAVCGVTSAGVLTPLKAGIAVITVSAPGFANYVFAVTVTA